jgi:hypothetical protein
MYICPHPTIAGHIVRVCGTRKLRITRFVTVAENFNTRALLACLAHESLPRTPLGDPAPTASADGVTRFLQDYSHTSDAHLMSVSHDPISGMPIIMTSYSPSLHSTTTVGRSAH